MMKKTILFLSILVVLMLIQCKTLTERNKTVSNHSAIDSVQTIRGYAVADTITYDVTIKNPYPEDTWTEECLKKLNRGEFIDQLFESVYSGNARAYDLIDNTPLTVKDLRKLEKTPDFSRSKIGKIQFTETWIYDEQNNIMIKKVIAMALGYELFDPDGNLIGYKPVFKVFLDQ